MLIKEWTKGTTTIELHDYTNSNTYELPKKWVVSIFETVTGDEYAQKNPEDYFVQWAPEFYTKETTERIHTVKRYSSRNAAMNYIRKLLNH